MVFVSCIEVLPCRYELFKLLQIAISCSTVECHACGDSQTGTEFRRAASSDHGQRCETGSVHTIEACKAGQGQLLKFYRSMYTSHRVK